jgi:drug/metabolite transporter (DMT)-like permease
MAALLALLASVVWGVADFLGGSYSRRLPTPVVMLWSQCVGLVSLAVVLALGGWRTPGAYLWWGVGGSLFGTLAGACFYRALALGTMSVVAPIAGTGLVVPVVVGLASGERPGAVPLAGILLATAGVVLASGPELRGVAGQRRSVLLAVAAACGFGGALALIPRAGPDRWAMTTTAITLTAVVMTVGYVLVARARAAPARAAPAAREPAAVVAASFTGVRLPVPEGPARRPAGGDLGGLGAIGALNVAALALYAYASGRGLVAVVSVLASLYSVVTVLLAYALLGERLRGVQLAGVAAAFAGVVCLAAG